MLPKEEFRLSILLADDNKDDQFFFAKALKAVPVKTQLNTVDDGEKLMDYLGKHLQNLPDALFLDLNMPSKNGAECLEEIKTNKQIKDFPVIIYSTSLNESIADILYEKGAHYFMEKCEIDQLTIQLKHILTLIAGKDLKRPSRDQFILKL